MNRKLRYDLVETGIEPKVAVVLASLIPDVSALDDLRAHMHKRFNDMDRQFARQRCILTGLSLLTIAAIVVSGILGG